MTIRGAVRISRKTLLVSVCVVIAGLSLAAITFADENKKVSTISSDKGKIVVKTFIVRKGIFMNSDAVRISGFRESLTPEEIVKVLKVSNIWERSIKEAIGKSSVVDILLSFNAGIEKISRNDLEFINVTIYKSEITAFPKETTPFVTFFRNHEDQSRSLDGIHVEGEFKTGKPISLSIQGEGVVHGSNLYWDLSIDSILRFAVDKKH